MTTTTILSLDDFYNYMLFSSKIFTNYFNILKFKIVIVQNLLYEILLMIKLIFKLIQIHRKQIQYMVKQIMVLNIVLTNLPL